MSTPDAAPAQQPAAPAPPVAAPAPPAAKPAPVGASGLTAAEESQLSALQAKSEAARLAAADPRYKVEPPHAEMTHANVTIGTEFTKVPASLAPAIVQAALDAGVKLTQEG